MYNKIVLIGNLARDPESRQTPTGVPVTHFTVAVSRPPRPSNAGGDEGAAAPAADFIPVVAWRRLAEICGEFLKKGKQVAVEGRIQVRSYVKDGETRTFTEVIADNVQMLGRRQDGASAPSTGSGFEAVASGNGKTAVDEPMTSEVPF